MAADPSSTSHSVPAPDPLAQALGPSPLEDFVVKHKVLVFGGIAAAAVGAAAAIAWLGMREANELEWARALASAASVADYEALVRNHPGSVVAGNALIRKATLLEEGGKPDEARTAWMEFRDGFPSHPLRDLGSLALARVAVDGEKREEARDLLSGISTASDLAPLAQLRLGDLARQEGDLVKAKTIYEPIQANYQVNPWARQVQERLDGLKLEERRAVVKAPATPPPAPAPEPTAEAKPTEDGKPPAAPQPTPEAKPAVDAKPAADAKPAVDAKPAADAKPPEEGKPKP